MPDISELNKLLAEALESINEESLVEKIMSKKRARKLRAARRAKLKQQAAQEKEKENDVIDAEVVDSEGDTEDNDREYKQLVVYNEKISGGENQQKDYSDAFKKFIKEINGLVTKYGETFANAERIWQQAGKDKPCPKEAYELYRQGLDGFKQELDTLLSTTLSQDAEKMAEEELTFIETQMMATSRFLEEYEKAITASNPQDIKLPVEVEDELQLPANPEEETSTELQVQSKTKKEPEARNWITFEQFEKMTKDPKVVWKQVTENEAELAKLSWGEFIKKNNPLSWFTEGMLGFIKSPVVRDFIKTLAYSNPLTAFIYDGKLGSLGLDGIKNSISKIGEYRDKRKAAKEKVAKDKKKDKEFYNEKGIPKDLSKLSISELRAEFYGNNHLVNLLNTAYNHPETDNNDAHELEQLSDKINKQFMKGNDFKKLEDVNRTEVVKNFTSLCTKLNEIADYQHWDNKKSFEKAKEEAEANKENRAKAVDSSKKKKENKKVKAINDLIKRYKNAKDKKYGEQEIVDAILRQYDDITSKQAQDYIDKWNKNNKHESYNITKNLNKLLEDSRSIKENKMNLTSLDEIKQDGLTVFMPSGIQATLFLEDDNVLVQYPNLQVDKYTKKDFQNIMDEGIFIFNDMPQNFPQIMESYGWSVSELELGDSGFDSPEEAYQNAKMCLEDSDYEVGDFDGEGFSVYDPGNEEMGYLPFDGYGVIESDEDDMDESVLMESEEPELSQFLFTYQVTDLNEVTVCGPFGVEYELSVNTENRETIHDDLEEQMDLEIAPLLCDEEVEITGTEIVGFKYDEDEKRGEFEFNIFYEPIDFEESLNENGLFKKELTPLPSKDASFKEGDIVTINGIKGEIIKVKPMKMSDTCTYQIKLDNGKTVWRYEEEINESLNEDDITNQEDEILEPIIMRLERKLNPEQIDKEIAKFQEFRSKNSDIKAQKDYLEKVLFSYNESLNEDANSIATELRNGNKSGTDKKLGQWKLKTSLDSNWENLTELVKTLILFNIADEVENGNLEMKDFAQYFDNNMDLTKEDLQSLDMFTDEEIDTMFSTNGYLECFITYEIQHLEDPSEDIEESLIDKLSKKGIIRESLVKEFKENNFQASADEMEESLNEEDEIKYYWGKTDQNKTLLVAGKSSEDAITNSKKFFTPELVFNSPEECDKEYDEIIDLKENIEEEKTLDFLGINQNDFTSKEELIKYIEENTDYDVLSSGDYWLNIIDRTQNDGEAIQVNLERKMKEAYEKTKRKEGDVFKALKNKKKEYLTPEFKTELLNSLDRIAREFPNVKVRQQATTFMDELGLQEYYDTKKIKDFIKKNLEVLNAKVNESLDEGKKQEQFKEKDKKKKKKKLDELNKEVNKMEELKEDCYKVYNSIENRECGTFNSWNEVEDFLNKEWGDYKASMTKENPEFGTDDDKYNFFGNYDMVTTQLPVAVVPAEIEVDVEATPEPVAEPVPEEPVIPQVCPNCGNEPCSCEKETCELCVEEPENCDGCADIEVPEDAEEIDMDAIIDEMCMTKLPEPKEVLDKDGKQEKKNKKEEDKNEDFKDNMGMLTDINDLDFPDALQNAVDTKEDGSLYRISDVAKMVSELKAEIDSLKSEFKTALDELKQGIKDDVKDIRTDVTSKLDNTDDKISELTAEEEDLEALEEPIEEEPAEETEEPTEEENTEDEELEEALKEMRKNPIYSQIKETFESNAHPKKLISIATVAQKIRENYGTDIKNDFTYELIKNICTMAPEFKEHVVDAETEKRTLKESMLGKAAKWISGGLMGILAQEKENKNMALIESYKKEAAEKAEKQNEDANEIKKEIDKLNAEGKNDKIKATIDVMSDTPEEREEAIDYAIQKVQESNANDLLRRLKNTSRTAAFSNLNIKG